MKNRPNTSAMGGLKLPDGLPDTRNPKDLDEHPLCRRLFPDGLGTEDEKNEMIGSVSILQRTNAWGMSMYVV